MELAIEGGASPTTTRTSGRSVYSYSISGLAVVSDIALPGLIPLEDIDAAPADAVIRAGDVPDQLIDADKSGPNWQIAGDVFRIEVPGVIAMLMTGGRDLVYAAAPGVSAGDAAIFISGTGFGILLHQRQRIVLHASAVRVRDSAVLFCGPSGAGKSTMAAALVDAGYDLVTDDFCGVSLDADGSPWVAPDGRQLKLWQNSIDKLDLGNRRAAAVRPVIEKFYVEPRGVSSVALPLAAIYVLRETRPPNVPGITRPNLIDGALMIRSNAYRPALVRRMNQQALYFQAAATISQRAAVFTLARDLSFADFPKVIGWLEAHWRELGLTEQAA